MDFMQTIQKLFRVKKLQNRLIVTIIAVILFLLSITGALFTSLASTILQEQIEKRAVFISKVLADNEEIRRLVIANDPDVKLPAMAEKIRQDVEAKFVVIGDRRGVRLAHPSPGMIGGNMMDDDGDDNAPALKEGRSYISHEHGSLGLSIRGKSPIFDSEGSIVGIVSVGYLMENVKSVIASYLMVIKVFIFILFTIGIVCAIYIARGVKKAIFGLEPKEIANLLQEKNAILESIREGVLAINERGQVSMVNQTALAIFRLESASEAIGRPVREIVPDGGISEVLLTGNPAKDVEVEVNGIPLIVNIFPIVHNSEVIGAVSSFRNKDELYRLAKELSRVKEYSEMLRAQTHEYSNNLHTIAGLIQIEAYSEALDMVIREVSGYQEFVKLMTSTMKDPLLSAIVIGKYNYAKEQDIDFTIDLESSMNDIPDNVDREKLVTVLGNLFNNAFEAVMEADEKKVTLSMTDLGDDIIFEVEDSGAGVSEEERSKIFDKGFSSKENSGRGLGLFFVDKLVREMNGTVETGRSQLGGAAFTVIIPKGAGCDER